MADDTHQDSPATPQVETPENNNDPTENEVQPQKEQMNKKLLCGFISVEPALFFYALYFSMAGPISQQFIYEIIAKQHNTSSAELRNDSLCGSNDSSNPLAELAKEVQLATSAWTSYLNAAQLPTALIATIILGGYSDTGGRKPPMILASLVSLGRILINIIIIQYKPGKPYHLIGAFLEGLGGSFGCYLMACFSYLSDVTTIKERVMRIVILETVHSIAATVGQLSTGFMILRLGFQLSFVVLAGILVINLIFVIFILPESRIALVKPKVFTTKHFTRLKDVYFGSGSTGDRRRRLLMAVAILLCCALAELGGSDALLLYVLDSPLCWGPVLIGYFGVASNISQSIGSLAATHFLQKRLAEMGLLIVGAAFAIVRETITAFSVTTWMVFLATVVGMISRLPIQMLRAYNSKVVGPDEQGAMYSGFALIQVSCGLGGSIIFSNIYSSTIEFFRGFVFLFGACLFGVAILLASFTVRRDKSHNQEPLYQHVQAEDHVYEERPEIL